MTGETEKQSVQRELFLSKGDISMAYAAINRVCKRERIPLELRNSLVIELRALLYILRSYDKLVGWREEI